MAMASITSTGLPAFRAVKRGQQSPFESQQQETGQENQQSSDLKKNVKRLNLESMVQNKKKIELAQEDKEIVNLKLLSDDFQIQNDKGRPLSNKDGLKAIMITRNENNNAQFEVQLLKVRSNGSTETLFQSNSNSAIQSNETNTGELNLRGSLLDSRA